MKKKTLWLSLIFAGLLAAVYLIMNRPGEQSRLVGEGDLFFDFDSSTVTAVHITSKSDTIILERRGTEWFVGKPLSYKADQQQVHSLVGLLANLRLETVVSSNPEKQSMFQVDSTGTRISLFDGTTSVAGLIIGKVGNAVGETYVRADGSSDVALVQGSLTYIGSRPVRDWRDKTIIEVPKEQIQNVAYQYGDTTFTLTFRDSAWFVDDSPADPQVVNGVLASLAHFTAYDFVDMPPEPPPAIAAAISYNGVQVRFSHLENTELYLVQGSGSTQWYEVQKWRANQVLKRKKDFLHRDV